MPFVSQGVHQSRNKYKEQMEADEFDCSRNTEKQFAVGKFVKSN